MSYKDDAAEAIADEVATTIGLAQVIVARLDDEGMLRTDEDLANARHVKQLQVEAQVGEDYTVRVFLERVAANLTDLVEGTARFVAEEQGLSWDGMTAMERYVVREWALPIVQHTIKTLQEEL